MKVVIIEDEIHNCRFLIGLIKELRPDWEIVETLESVKETVDWFQNNPHPDLIFMDIQLTDGISFSVFDHVDLKSMIIFTTAYDEYAVQAFKVNSIDYLLKPIKKEHLEMAIDKFEVFYTKTHTTKETPDYKELLRVMQNGEKKYRTRFLVAGTTAFHKIETHNIAYFYTGQRVTRAVLFDGKEHVVDMTMEKLEEQLDPHSFYRVNRGYILNIEAIKRFENYFGGKLIVKLEVPLDETITISRLKAAAFKNWLDGDIDSI